MADETRQKDPKKVAAGRQGAQARKAKQECLLSELRAAKERLKVASDGTSGETINDRKSADTDVEGSSTLPAENGTSDSGRS